MGEAGTQTYPAAAGAAAAKAANGDAEGGFAGLEACQMGKVAPFVPIAPPLLRKRLTVARQRCAGCRHVGFAGFGRHGGRRNGEDGTGGAEGQSGVHGRNICQIFRNDSLTIETQRKHTRSPAAYALQASFPSLAGWLAGCSRDRVTHSSPTSR